MSDFIVERIKLLLEDKGLSPSVFADTIDIQRSSMSHMLSGRNKPSLDVIQKILGKFPDINSTWLLTGKGKMKQLDLFGADDEKRLAAPSPIVITDKPKNEEPIKVEKLEKELPQEPEKIVTVSEPIFPPQPLKEKITPELTPPALPNTSAEQKPVKPIPTVGEKQIEKIFVFYTDKTFSVYKPE